MFTQWKEQVYSSTIDVKLVYLFQIKIIKDEQMATLVIAHRCVFFKSEWVGAIAIWNFDVIILSPLMELA